MKQQQLSLLFKYILILFAYSFQYIRSAVDYSDIETIELTCAGGREGCTVCNSDDKSCSRCDLGYFLYKLPAQFTPDQGIQRDQYTCIKCPYYQNSITNNIKCGDCVDNPNTWALTRRCTYEYQGNFASKDADNIFSRMNNTFTYQTSVCNGCDTFCGDNRNLQYCNVNPKSTSIELLQTAFTCQVKYYYYRGKCKPCNSDKSCLRCTDDTKCDVCEEGYALNEQYKCIQCNQAAPLGIPNCFSCFYGDEEGNNYSEHPENFPATPDPTILMRCKTCKVKTTLNIGQRNDDIYDFRQMVIPELDLRSCLECATQFPNCKRCDYTKKSSLYIHSEDPQVIKTADQSHYDKRCRKCEESYYVKADGQCEIIKSGPGGAHENCLIPMMGDINSLDEKQKFPTLNIRIASGEVIFEDRDLQGSIPPIYQEFCAVCKEGYKTGPALTCNISVNDNCKYYMGTVCIACKRGYLINGIVCVQENTNELDSCDNYYSDGTQLNCLQCSRSPGSAGMYPDYNQRKCVSCDENCDECTEYNSRFTFDEVKFLLRPEMDEDDSYFYKEMFKLKPTTWCKTCDPSSRLNPMTGRCFGCSKTTCDNGKCSFDSEGPVCLKSKLSVLNNYKGNPYSKAQTLDKSGTVYCSDYQSSCSPMTDAQKVVMNPFLGQNSYYLGMSIWSQANLCQTIPNIFYNSYTQKCQICNASQKACKKKVTIYTFIDGFKSDIFGRDSMQWSDYKGSADVSMLKGVINNEVYLLYNIDDSETKLKTINLGKAITDSIDPLVKNYIKYSEEGVEEIEFKFIFINQISSNAGILKPIALGFELNIDQTAFMMIPSLKDVKITLTTMENNKFDSIGQNKLQLYLSGFIYLNSFTSVEFNNIDLSPLCDFDSFEQKIIYGIKLQNTLLPTKITLKNVNIFTTQTIASQKSTYYKTGTLSYFQLYSPNMSQLILVNFQLKQFFYPPAVNFYYPGLENNPVSFSFSTAKFENLQFDSVNIFQANHTDSNFLVNDLSLKTISITDGAFISESSLLNKSNLKFDLYTLTFEDITLEDSFLINVMNAIKFNAKDWTIKTPFKISSETKKTAIFQTNYVSLENFNVISQTDNSQNPPQLYKFILNKATIFKTPPYSLLVQYSLQINHRYTKITVDQAVCNLSTKSDTIQVTNCIFDLEAPYNSFDYLLNVKFESVTVKNTQTSNKSNGDSDNSQVLISLKSVDSIDIKDLYLYANYHFNGLTIYNPIQLQINNFICGEETDANFNKALSWKDDLQKNTIDSDIITGSCMSLAYCQKNIELKKLYLQNYVGKNISPFEVTCPSEIKLASDKAFPIIISDFTITNAIILMTEQEIIVAPIKFTSEYQFNIQISGIQIVSSYLLGLSDFYQMTFPSSSGIYLNSVSSQILVDYANIKQTTSLKTSNSLYILSESVVIQNSLFVDSNVDLVNSPVSSGGNLYLSASSIDIYKCNFRNSNADKGGSIYVQGLQSTKVKIRESIFEVASTAKTTKSDGQGGGVYIDGRLSEITLLIDLCTFNQIFARTQGGILYMVSGTRQATATISNSMMRNMYAPQGSLVFWDTQSDNNKLIISNNQFIWDDLGKIYQFIDSLLAAQGDLTVNNMDSLLKKSLEEHSFIYMSRGKLLSDTNTYFGIKYQMLLSLIDLHTFEDTASVINGYTLVTYPLIKLSDTTKSVILTSTQIFNVKPCTDVECDSDEKPFLKYIDNTATSIIHIENSSADFSFNKISFSNNILISSWGLISFVKPNSKSVITFKEGSYKNNQNRYGVVNIQKSLSASRLRFRLLASVNPTVIFDSVLFEDNQGLQGSAIYCSNTDLMLTNAVFNRNIASDEGGALYFTAPITDTNSQLIFNGVTFTNNVARVGGAYRLQGVPIKYIDNAQVVMQGNTALVYGNDNADYARSLQVIYNGSILKYSSQSSSTITIKNYGSGQNPGNLVLQLLGSDNKVFFADSTTCSAALNYPKTTKPDTAQIVGTAKQEFNSLVKGFNMTDLVFIVKPPLSLEILFKCDAIKIPSTDASNPNSYDTSYTFPLTLSMRECQAGEIYQSDTGKCYACPAGKYSLLQGSESCLNCPKIGVEECPGYNMMNVSDGYWRRNTSSDIIVECNNLKENCIGGMTKQLCYEGHIGALCEECDLYGEVWGESYAHSAQYKCGKCSDVSSNVLKIVGISIWTIISIVLSVKSSTQLIQLHICRDSLITFGFISAGRSTKPQNQTGVLIKILTSYFQIISVIFTFKLTTPSFFSDVTNTVGNPSQQMSMSMDCFLMEFSGDIHVTYFGLIWMLVNPLLYVGLGVVVFLIYFTIMTIKKQIEKAKKSLSYIWCTCIFLFITFQPSMVSAYIATASCRTIGDTDYVKSNVSLICYTSTHVSYLVKLILPVLLFWVAFIPSLFFMKLYSSSQQIYKRSSIKYAFGYLYFEYQPNAYLWEFVKMFQKIMVIIFINVYDSDVKVKGVLSFMCIIIYLILSYTFKPYQDIVLTRLDQLANEVAAISIIIGVFIYDNDYDYLVGFGYVCLVCFNLYFIIMILRNLFKGYTQIIDTVFFKNFEKIIKKFEKYPKIKGFLERKHKKYVSPKRVQDLWFFVNKKIMIWREERKKNINAQLIMEGIVYAKDHLMEIQSDFHSDSKKLFLGENSPAYLLGQSQQGHQILQTAKININSKQNNLDLQSQGQVEDLEDDYNFDKNELKNGYSSFNKETQNLNQPHKMINSLQISKNSSPKKNS